MKSITTTNQFATSELNHLQRELNLWRSTQRERAPLPESVWRSAAVLARSLGVSGVSRALRLNYEKLNRWAAENTDRPRDLPSRATFVELAVSDAKAAHARPEYRVEIADATADKLTLYMGGDVKAVLAVAESFWRRKQ